MATLTWLHLSDLHYRQRSTWDAFRVLKTLQADLKQMEESHALRPDFFVFTGDVAYGTTGHSRDDTLEGQYDGALDIIEEVRNAFTVPVLKANTFLVPGNHDVERAMVIDEQTYYLDERATLDDVTERIRTGDRSWCGYMDRLTKYREFLVKGGYDHLLADPTRLVYAETREIAGRRIGIAGLNTVWSCGRNSRDEKGKLWFGGRWQTGHVLQHLGDVDIGLALMHHPSNWFREEEDPSIGRDLERDFTFVLHGHEHQNWVLQEAQTGHVRIAAAACYDRSDHVNGYNFVRIDLESGEAEVWLRQYDREGGGWIPRTIHQRTNNDGTLRLQRVASRSILDVTDASSESKISNSRVLTPLGASERVTAIPVRLGLPVSPSVDSAGTSDVSPDSIYRNSPQANQGTSEEIAAQSRIEVASSLLERGQPMTARNVLENVRSEHWDSITGILRAKIANNQGVAELDLGNHDSAKRYFEEALAYEPEDHKIRANVAASALITGEFNDALDQSRRVLERQPNNEQAASTFIQALYRTAGMQAVQEWVAEPEQAWVMVSPNCLGALATVAYEEQDFARCEDLLKRALEVGTNEG